MNTSNKEEARKRTEMLAEQRKQHGEHVKQAQERLKEQQVARRALRRAMEAGPRSVPQLAEETGIPAHEVLWHMAAMKKYGLVEEAGVDDNDEYYLYALKKEAES